MKRANFTACAIEYMSSPSLIARYNYSGPVQLLSPNPLTQITYEGCLAVCGPGVELYSWSESAAFITTWVLPILGTLLQAPFESNAAWATVKAVGRWVGSPMATMAYVLWNVEVGGKCALFVDMAIPYETPIPDENSAFASMRDSLYILMNTNQYGMKPIISMTKEAEGLLRIVLFSEDLQLVGSKKTLKQLREKLARELRSNRRRGVVPVFVSTLWFLFALAISIQAAFGYLGDNAQAHYLALGLFMSWFPVLVLCSIVDRNPVASDDIKRKLNKLVDLVCDSLIDPETRNAYIDSLKDSPGCERMAYWVEKISKQAPFIKEDFFTDFAGQGRKRFHYGAAHAILLDIEAAYIADRGRNWLANEPEARGRLVLGRVEEGLVSFDGRQLWQVLASFGCVAGTSTGAFLLSYFTPTVGLSCRSGGFLVFGVTCLALLLAEYGIWWYTSPVRTGKLHEMVERRTSFQSERSMAKARNHHRIPHRRHIESNQRFWTAAENTAIRISRICIRVLPMKNRHTRIETAISAIHTHIATLQTWTLRDWSEVLFFTPIEFLNTVWLVVLTMAQTIGAFVTCACQCSIWGFGGGYLDFTQWQVSNSPHIYEFWLVGTVVSCVCMGVGFVYIVLEWCLQAHLSTENYADAMVGLKRVRRFRRYTFRVRYPGTLAVLAINHLARALGFRRTSKRKTLVWRKTSRDSTQA